MVGTIIPFPTDCFFAVVIVVVVVTIIIIIIISSSTPCSVCNSEG